MKNQIFSKISGILSFFLFPYLLTILLNGVNIALINREPDVEWYLPVMISAQIDDHDSLETIKAQAIIARTNFYYQLGQERGVFAVLQEVRKNIPLAFDLFQMPDAVYEKAVTETKNQVLTFQDQLQLVPYHAVSSGKTRSGAEVFHDENYAYLKSVDSSVDKEAADYLNSSYANTQQMPEKLEIVERDSAGYITKLAADGSILGGEQFRQEMGLSSSDFTVQKIGSRYRFLCKGKGHGLGFSQYGGNELAKAGNTSQEILKIYFPEMEIQNINGVYFAKSE